MLDSLERNQASGVFISARPQGYFLSWAAFDTGTRALLWLNAAGAVERQGTTTLNALYADAVGDTAVFVQSVTDGAAGEEIYTVHATDMAGNAFAVDTLARLPYTLMDMPGGYAVTRDARGLALVAAVAHTDVDPVAYTATVATFDGGAAWQSALWTPGDMPPSAHILTWALARTADGGFLAACAVGGGEAPALWGVPLDSTGRRGDTTYVQSLVAGFDVSGLALYASGGTIYSCFTLNSATGLERGGAYLSAYPLTAENLPAPEPRPWAPARPGLSAYPNPFNSTVRLSYAGLTPAPAVLRIFDLSGHLVVERPLAASASGTCLFQAGHLPTGTYFAQLGAEPPSPVVKLLLIR